MNLNLPRLCVKHRITAEKFLSHLFFHKHALPVKLLPHHTVRGHRHKIIPVHYFRYVMSRNASPVGNTGRTVLISSRIPAVRIALGMTDQNRNIRIIHIFIHNDMIPGFRVPEILKMCIILAVVACDAPDRIKLFKKCIPEYHAHLFYSRPRVEPV